MESGSTFIFSKARIKDLIRPYNRDTSETSLDLIAQKSKYAAVATAMKHSWITKILFVGVVSAFLATKIQAKSRISEPPQKTNHSGIIN